MKSTSIFYITLALLFSVHVLGQTKQEREYRLKIQKVPIAARQFVDSIQSKKKIHWYYEENLTGNSVEAKLTFRKKKYSIEFDTLGNLQDVEILINWAEIPKKVQNNITSNLDSVFTVSKIKKIQIQYIGNNAALLDLAKKQFTNREYTTNYELIVVGKKDTQKKLYEVVFSQNGAVNGISEIIFKNTDNLEF